MFTSKNSLIILSIILGLTACSEQKSGQTSVQQEKPTSVLPEPQSPAQEQNPPEFKTAQSPPPAEEAMGNKAAEMAPEAAVIEESMAESPVRSQTSVPTAQPAPSGHAPSETKNPKQTVQSGMFAKEILSRKFIYRAGLKFQVKDVYQSALAIEDMAYAAGGFVLKNEIQSNSFETQNTPQSDKTILQITRFFMSGEMIVRVPTHQTQEFLRKLSSQIVHLDIREFSAQDVQFDSLREQLAFQRAQETQQNLGQAITQTRSDTKLNAIYGQDRMKRVRDQARVSQAVFEDQTAYSTIRIMIYQPEQIRKNIVEDTQAVIDANKPSFASRIQTALQTSWDVLLNIIVGLVTYWIFWLTILIVSVYLWKKHKLVREEQERIEAEEVFNEQNTEETKTEEK